MHFNHDFSVFAFPNSASNADGRAAEQETRQESQADADPSHDVRPTDVEARRPL